MPRTPVKGQAPAQVGEILPAAQALTIEAQRAATEVQETARALAAQLGYDGALSVGVLEDEIRFYQRRSVEALLECGKRLLLLKEMTPHSEFTQRVELLGFHIRTAQRFMGAAMKVAKSDKLSFLAAQVKSSSAFLELVTHDDDADIERVAELDDIDRMSASQLRAALRESKQEAQAQQEVLSKKNARIDKLERDLSRIRHLPPDEALKKLQQEAAAIAADAEGLILGGVRQGLLALSQEDGNQSVFMAGLLGQLQARLNALREEFHLPDTSAAHDAEMAAKVAAWAPPANAAASAA